MIWVHGSDCQDGHARGSVLRYRGVVERLCEGGRVVVDVKDCNIHHHSDSEVSIVDFNGLCAVVEGEGVRKGGRGEGGKGVEEEWNG